MSESHLILRVDYRRADGTCSYGSVGIAAPVSLVAVQSLLAEALPWCEEYLPGLPDSWSWSFGLADELDGTGWRTVTWREVTERTGIRLGQWLHKTQLAFAKRGKKQ